MLVRLLNKSNQFDSNAEKQHEDDQVVLILVVLPTSRQPKIDRLFPIVFIYFVNYQRMVRFFNKSDRFNSDANPQCIIVYFSRDSPCYRGRRISAKGRFSTNRNNDEKPKYEPLPLFIKSLSLQNVYNSLETDVAIVKNVNFGRPVGQFWRTYHIQSFGTSRCCAPRNKSPVNL